MKLKLNIKITNLKGEFIKADEKTDATVGLMLSNIVLEPHKDKNGFRPLKAYELAKKFFEKEEVELDKSDVIQIKELVENCAYQPLIVAQILEAIINAESEEK